MVSMNDATFNPVASVHAKTKAPAIMSDDELITEGLRYTDMWYDNGVKVRNAPRFVDVMEALIARLQVKINEK